MYLPVVVSSDSIFLTREGGGRGWVSCIKFWKVRARLHRRLFLRHKTHFAAFFEIYSRRYWAKKSASSFLPPKKNRVIILIRDYHFLIE